MSSLDPTSLFSNLWQNLDTLRSSDPSKYKEIIEKSGEELSKSSEKEPKPHLCLRLRHKDSKTRDGTHILNIFSWTKIKEPGRESEPFPLAGGFKTTWKDESSIFNVATSPGVLHTVTVQGTFKERDHFVKLVLLFLQGQGHEEIQPNYYKWEYIRGKEVIGDVKKTILGFYGLTPPTSSKDLQFNSTKEKEAWIKPRECRRLKRRENFLIGKCFYRHKGVERPVAVEYRVYLPDVVSCQDILLQIEGTHVLLMTIHGQQERLRDIKAPSRIAGKAFDSYHKILSFQIHDKSWSKDIK